MSRALRFLAAMVSVCAFSVSLCGAAGASPADVDRSFGREGFVNLPREAQGRAYGEDLAVGPDGSLYVLRSVQTCFSSCSIEHRLAKFLANGAADGSFGVGGVSTMLGAASDGPTAFEASLALGADGRTVVAWVDRGKLIIQRLDTGGALDPTFGSAGTVKFDFGFPIGHIRIAVQGDGKVVVAAEPEIGYAGDAVIVARFTGQGAADPSWGNGAPVITSLGSGVGAMVLGGGESVLIAGPRCCGLAGSTVHVARLSTTGAFDVSFGHAGRLFVDDVTDSVAVSAVVVRPSGLIYVVGAGRAKADPFAMRLLPSGKLDRRFGHAGIAHMRQARLKVVGAGVDRTGKLLIFGSAAGRLGILRRLTNGRPDRTFGGGSLVRIEGRGGVQAVAGGVQKGRGLVLLGNGSECSRTCPPPVTFLVRVIGGSAASRCAGRRATIVGTRENDVLVGTRRTDVIVALAGDDSVRGRGGDDVICGGRGDDRLVGGPGRDVLRGGSGRNQIQQ